MKRKHMKAADTKMKSVVDQLAVKSSVEERLSAMRCEPSKEGATIFKVPHTIRSAQPEAYEPKFVGIGLFHHSLKLPEGHPTTAAESHKLRYFLDLLKRNQSLTWKDYVNAMIRWKPLAFGCYSESPPPTVSREVLMEGMVLDACFILELFLKAADKGRNLQGDPIYGTPWLIQQIAYDLVLMENQLPFIVLESVYKIFRGPPPFPTFSHKQELIDLALDFFNMWFTKKDSSSAGGMQTNKTNSNTGAGSVLVDLSPLGGLDEEDSSSHGGIQTNKTNPGTGSTLVDELHFVGHDEWFTKKDSSSAGGMQTNDTNPGASNTLVDELHFVGHDEKDSSSDGGMQTIKTNPAGSTDVSLVAEEEEEQYMFVNGRRVIRKRLRDKIEGGEEQEELISLATVNMGAALVRKGLWDIIEGGEEQHNAAGRANNEVQHLLHLLYQNFFNLDPPKNDKNSKVYLCFPIYRYTNAATDEEENLPNNQKVTIPTVTHLRDAGVRLCEAKRANHLAVKFINGRLEIPFFLLEESSDSVIRNLIAFEQCCRNSIYQHNYSLSLYAYFLSRLVNTENDVQMMRESGVLEHFLGSDEEAAKFFNKLCHGIVIDFRRTYLGEVCKQLNQYYQFRPHMWRANLMRDYFSNPWSILSLVAALLLLLLTLLQTLYSVLSYKKSG